MEKFPRSAYDTVGGLVYLPRMCDKIRLHAAGELPAPYHANLGGGFDARFCAYLHVDYAALRERVLAGASDDEAAEWCFTNGRRLNDVEILVWNGFARKRGWRDDDGGSDFLQKSKEASDLDDRDDICTLFDYYDADEGRSS